MKKRAKTQFVSRKIRKLRPEERSRFEAVISVLSGDAKCEAVAMIPGFVSADSKQRSLLFGKIIADKILRDHGKFLPENFVINANDWDGVLKNLSNTTTGHKDEGKINLIKKIPRSRNYLLIAANKDNDFFVVSHFETIDGDGNKLKSLLGRGELFSKSGKPLAPDEFLVAPPARKQFQGGFRKRRPQ